MTDRELLELLVQKMSAMEGKMNNRFDILETKLSIIQSDVTDIKASIQRLEENEPADILAMLNNINNKLDERTSDINVLNKRLFKVESTTERLTNQ